MSRHARELLAGVGVTGSLVAAIVAVSALVGGVLAFDGRRSESEPAPVTSTALSLVNRPLPLVAAPPPAGNLAPARGAAARSASGLVLAPAARPPAVQAPPSIVAPAPPGARRPTGRGPAVPAPAPSPAAPGPASPTARLARMVADTANAAARATAGAPPVAAAVAGTGAAAARAVDGAGTALSGVLGASSAAG